MLLGEGVLDALADIAAGNQKQLLGTFEGASYFDTVVDGRDASQVQPK